MAFRLFGFGTTDYRAYSADEKAVLAAHLGRWPEDGVADAVQISRRCASGCDEGL